MVTVDMFKWQVQVGRYKRVKIEAEVYEKGGMGYFFQLYCNGKATEGWWYFGEEKPKDYKELQEVVKWNCWWLFENVM